LLASPAARSTHVIDRCRPASKGERTPERLGDRAKPMAKTALSLPAVARELGNKVTWPGFESSHESSQTMASNNERIYGLSNLAAAAAC
jgi:hypothetical protein